MGTKGLSFAKRDGDTWGKGTKTALEPQGKGDNDVGKGSVRRKRQG